MRKAALITVMLVFSLGIAAFRAEASSVTYNFDAVIGGTGVTPSATSFGTLTFTDLNGLVGISINLSNSAWKLLETDFNYADSKFSNLAAPLSLASNTSLSIGNDSIKADGYPGMLDVGIKTSVNSSSYSDTIEPQNGLTYISAADFGFKDSQNNIYAALHIGNYGGGNSIWVGATSTGQSAAPIPGSALLLGSGFLCLLGLRGILSFGV